MADSVHTCVSSWASIEMWVVALSLKPLASTMVTVTS